ncbi:MAG: accessory gene regulator B family protein [Tissierellia bacterium]|nr:accessory gene regulator B family protein [Tissierellia bacterium]
MLHKLAEDISLYLITNKIIDIEERDIYIYGIELLISTLLTSISILILAFFIGELVSAVIFLLIHFLLKSYTGGYHANYYYQCYIYSILNFIILIIAKTRILLAYKPVVALALLVISIMIIFKYAPVTNKNNPKTEEEISRNKKIARKRVLLLSLIPILGYVVKAELIDIWFMMALTIFSIAYSIVINIFMKRKEQIQEQ